MDIGDLVFLLILGIGFLSSLGGAKKKRRQANRQSGTPPTPRTPVASSNAPLARPERKSRLTEARERAMSQMEELLRELESGGKSPTPPRPREITAESNDIVVDSPDLHLPPSAPAPREMPPSVPAKRDGTLHKVFHDKYIRPVGDPRVRLLTARSKRHLSPQSLKEAVLLREILGPPKALQ